MRTCLKNHNARQYFPRNEKSDVRHTRTSYVEKHIVKDYKVTTTEYRMYWLGNEAFKNIIRSCRKLASNEFTVRHNNVVKTVDNELCVQYRFMKGHSLYYQYNPESVLENDIYNV